MGVLDTMTRLGDAVAGVNPLARYKGQAEVDEIQARTDSALALARERRIQAEQAQMEQDALQRISSTPTGTFTDVNNVPIGDLILGKRGSDYSSVMEGRNRGQTFNEHATVDTPAPIGDVAAEANRQAALDSLAPSSAIALRRPSSSGSPVIVQGEQGPEYSTPGAAIGKPPGARPSAPKSPNAPGPTSQQRNIDDLVARGVAENDALDIVYRRATPLTAYNSVLRGLLSQKDIAGRPVYTPESAQQEAEVTVEALMGVGSLKRAAQPAIPPPAAAPTGDRPPLDSFFK